MDEIIEKLNQEKRDFAKRTGWTRYYLTKGHVGRGNYPKENMMDMILYAIKTKDKIKDEIFYNRELTEEELEKYDLVKAD